MLLVCRQRRPHNPNLWRRAAIHMAVTSLLYVGASGDKYYYKNVFFYKICFNYLYFQPAN